MGHDHRPTNTLGIRPIPIAGRMTKENERIKGMTPEDRAWRSQWLKDLELSPREPVEVPELRKELMNPIRRFYRKPLDKFYQFLLPRVGHYKACLYRYRITAFASMIAVGYFSAYYLKYNQRDWTRGYGWRVTTTKPRVLPGDPGYPFVSDKQTPQDFADGGFKNRKVFLD
ncbi:NADH dehydrogenase (ubiquinone) 1 beta subcomplex, 6 [Chamberlinius hualienensis]